jgi:hypothetical protein
MSQLSNVLHNLIDHALFLMEADPDQVLPPELRETILLHTGTMPKRGQSLTTGQQRRLGLIMQSANYVLPIWSANYPQRRLPSYLLATMAAFLRQQTTFDQIVTCAEEFARTEAPLGNLRTNAGQAAGMSIWLAFCSFEVLFGDNLSRMSADEYANESLIYAARAVALHRQKQDSLVAYSEQPFWHWWLTTAIPLVWQSTTFAFPEAET